ncbi:MAG: DedA family protein [Usitatibacter sp.]
MQKRASDTIMDIPGLIDTYGYWAVFVGAFLEGETILALAGLAAYRGYLDFWAVVFTAMIAGFLGDQFFFFLGRYKGSEILARFPNWKARAHRFDDMLARWHAPLIVCIRFMYGFRIMGPIMLGMGRVPAWKFMVYNFIGAVIWAPLIAGIGYLFGGALEAVLHDLKRFEVWAAIAILLIGLATCVVHLVRVRRREAQPVSTKT